jgi:5-methylcytosine-specific restriction endonuclease McrA
MVDNRTYADRRVYLINAVKKRRKFLRQKAVQYKGGQCTICGYKSEITALEFHHLDETKKDFGLSQRGLTRSWSRIREELDKCILVCANCHREIHSGHHAAFARNGEMNSG